MASEHLIEIFKNSCGAVYQCNRANRYVLKFGALSSSFRVRDFLHFKQQIQKIDLEELLHSSSRTTDVVVLMPHYTERCFVLTLNDILNLRELLRGACFMINLNSLVSETLQQNLAPSYLD